ncbi:hypothetical protein BRD14_00270 [Halobacteriales archaeon SW_5_68_122]|nr:MAG: hypothetical protein BRD14_00270 [Halobacteriales archaeon SW_5_68_122]
MLHARGLLARVDGEYEPADRMLGFLTKTDLRSVGAEPAAVDAFERWVHLPETLAGAAPLDPPDATRNDLGRGRTPGPLGGDRGPEGETVALLRDDAGRRAVEFATREWAPTLVAPPERIEAAEPLLRSAPVELVAGGPDDLPTSDLVVGVKALSGRDPAAAPIGVFLDALRGETADA